MEGSQEVGTICACLESEQNQCPLSSEAAGPGVETRQLPEPGSLGLPSTALSDFVSERTSEKPLMAVCYVEGQPHEGYSSQQSL